MSNQGFRVEGKVAFVSGANRGIGLAISKALLAKGVKTLYAGARNPDTLDSLVQGAPDKVVAVRLDVTDSASIRAAAETVGDVNILVNNAGVFQAGGIFGDQAVTSLSANLDVNLFGLVNLTRALSGSIRSGENGAIVNVSSIAGLANMPMAAMYSVSKAAVHSVTQGMRGELADDNVLVVGVYPGPIDTDMARGIDMEKDTPTNVASAVIKAIESGNEDLFPDVMSSEVGAGFMANPKAVEQQFASYTG